MLRHPVPDTVPNAQPIGVADVLTNAVADRVANEVTDGDSHGLAHAKPQREPDPISYFSN